MFYKITHDLININAPSYSLPGDARTRGVVLADVVVSGSLFQSVVVLGKKENL
jgi:hypothetical protein